MLKSPWFWFSVILTGIITLSFSVYLCGIGNVECHRTWPAFFLVELIAVSLSAMVTTALLSPFDSDISNLDDHFADASNTIVFNNSTEIWEAPRRIKRKLRLIGGSEVPSKKE